MSITEKAAEQVRSIWIGNAIPETHGLRVGVKGGGCSGLSYVLGFQDGLNGKGFVFNNPNAQQTCECGSSFSA